MGAVEVLVRAVVIKMSSESRPGDWVCSECQFMNYASRTQCKNCAQPGGTSDGAPNPNARPGDWACPSCKYSNYASREVCYKCRCPKGADGDSFRAGDWWCAACSYHNYASRHTCYKCNAPKMNGNMMGFGGYGGNYGGAFNRGFGGNAYGGGGFGDGGFGWNGGDFGAGGRPGNVRPGDWPCSSCGFNNYASRNACFKCSNPKQPGSEYGGFGGMPGGGGYGGGGNFGRNAPEIRHGDWMCPSCATHNFASREKCFRCDGKKPSTSEGENFSGEGGESSQSGGNGGDQSGMPSSFRAF